MLPRLQNQPSLQQKQARRLLLVRVRLPLRQLLVPVGEQQHVGEVLQQVLGVVVAQQQLEPQQHRWQSKHPCQLLSAVVPPQHR